jgi:hypothetical protein
MPGMISQPSPAKSQAKLPPFGSTFSKPIPGPFSTQTPQLPLRVSVNHSA